MQYREKTSTVSNADLTGENRLARNAIISWAGHFVLVISGFIMPRMIDQHIGQTQLGIWDLCWSFVNYLNLLGLGVGSSVNRFVAKYRVTNELEKLSQAVSSVALIQAVLASLVLIGTIIIIMIIPPFYSTQLGNSTTDTQYVVGFLGLSLTAQMFFDTSRGIITGCHRWDIHNSIHASVSVVNLAVMVFVLIQGGGLFEIALVYCSVVILFEMVRLFYAKRILPTAKIRYRSASLTECKRMLNFGLGTVLLRLPSVILVQTVNVILAIVLGPAVLAIFSRPIALVRHVRVFISKFSFILTPSAGAMQDNRSQLREFLVDTTRISVALTLPIMMILVIFGDMIMKLWMGQEYADWWLVAILALGYLLPIAQDTIISVLIGMDRHKKIAWSLLAVVISMALLIGVWVSISGWSMHKAAILIALPMSISHGLLLPYLACRELELSFAAYWRNVVVMPIIYNIPVIGLLWAARMQVEQSNIQSAVLLFIAAIAVLIIIYSIAVLPAKFKRRIRNMKLLKNSFKWMAHFSGVLGLVRFLESKKIIIFMLHSVMSLDRQNNWNPLRNHLSPESLESTLRTLSKYYQFISLNDAVEMLAGKQKLQPYSMVITFDDGYRNNISQALPILKKFNIVPTIFVATHYIDSQLPYWFDRLDYAIQLESSHNKTIKFLDKEIIIDNNNRKALRKTFDKFRMMVKKEQADGKGVLDVLNNIAGELESIAGVDIMKLVETDEWISILSWGEIASEVDKDNIRIGSHTVNHPSLVNVYGPELAAELEESKRKIESELSTDCNYFCYPYGHLNEETVQAVRSAGYVAALTTAKGKNSVGDDLFRLKRISFPLHNRKIDILYYISCLREKLIKN